ncbi:acyl-CoA dehydrogenase/oxidase [Aspergillus egyptiacus]|nr:acyl-CoA dehydrogenase/oxidase [Aspergillus egyptiacus]
MPAPEPEAAPGVQKLQTVHKQLWPSAASTTAELARSPLFKPSPFSLSIVGKSRLTYERAKKICEAFGLTVDDILGLNPPFLKIHTDLMAAMDGGAMTLISIQYNLFVGTVARFAAKRPELRDVLQRAMKFEISAQFMLTEVGHGLDARNLETTATLLPNGGFELHSPSWDAAKCMPPTTPRSGFPTVAVVMARLIVADEDRGVRPFLVPLGDGRQMCKGITAKVLPPRTGAHVIDHALTRFERVQLPASALLGRIEIVENERNEFLSAIQRVAAGTLVLSATAIPALKLAIFNAGRFSFRRTQLPILHAIAQYQVLQAFLVKAVATFRDVKADPRVRHAGGTAFKAVAVQHCNKSLRSMNERCGWHGHFEHDQILQDEMEFRANGTAEGDIRILAIRLASELLIGRYEMPRPNNPESPLARHEAALLAEAGEDLQRLGGVHRSEGYNRNILPLSLALVQAIGHRMAFEAAIEAEVDPRIVALYASGIVLEDSAWYTEQGALSRKTQQEMEARAADALVPELERLVAETGAEEYCSAPMTSAELWDGFVAELEEFRGAAELDILGLDSRSASGTVA